VFREVQDAKNSTEETATTLVELEAQIKEFLDLLGATPNDIRTLAQDVRFKTFLNQFMCTC